MILHYGLTGFVQLEIHLSRLIGVDRLVQAGKCLLYNANQYSLMIYEVIWTIVSENDRLFIKTSKMLSITALPWTLIEFEKEWDTTYYKVYHNIMLWDLLDRAWSKISSKQYGELLDKICSSKAGDLWSWKDKPINDQPKECIDDIFNLLP